MPDVAMIVSNPCNPDPRVEKEALSLQNSGFNVIIHAFDRQENSDSLSKIEGVQIKRYKIGITPIGAPSLLIGVKVLNGLRKFRKKVLTNLLISPPDFVHCHDADTLAIGLTLKSKKGTKLVFDMHDLAHSWIRMANPSSNIRRLIASIIEKRVIKQMDQCDLIITSSGAISPTSHPGFKQWIQKRTKDVPVVVVENRPLPTDSIRPLPEQFTIGYAGKIREKSMFNTLIQAAENLPPEISPKLIIAGHGTADSEVDELFSHTTLPVERIGEFRTEDLPSIVRKLSVMYAVYPTPRGNILEGALPTKMFDAAIHGRPSIVNSNCLMEDVVNEEKLGVAVEPTDRDSLQTALYNMAKAKRLVKLERDWYEESERLVSAYQSIGNDS